MALEQTLPKLLAKRAAMQKEEVALRQKNLGIWKEITWGEYFEKASELALALSNSCDFKRGEKLAIIGDNCPQWLISQMAAQILGGISIGIYQESLSHQLLYYLKDCKPSVVVALDQEQVEKLLAIEEKIPFVRCIVVCNDQGMGCDKHPKIIDFNDLVTKGKLLMNKESNFLRTETERGLSHDIAIIAYSSSTTGKPKGVMLSHHHLIAAARYLGDVDKMEKNDDYLSFLPLAWIHEQVMSIVVPLANGMVINFPEESNTVLVDLREIGPHTVLAPPRVYESIISNFTIRIQETSWFKKKIYQLFKRFGEKMAEAKLKKRPVSAGIKLMYLLGDFLIFSAIRDHLGLARIKRAYVAGAALGTEAFYFFHSIGVNVKQSYGGTEVAGIAFVHRDGDTQMESTGKPLPNTEVKISDKGEIFLKNPSVFTKYLNESDYPQDDLEWVSLGDCGQIDENGHLHVIDRKADMITMTNGETVPPSMVENKLKASPYVQEAVCFGQNKPFMSAIVNIDRNTVGRWAEKNQIDYTTYLELATKPEVAQLIEKEISDIMIQLPQQARLKKFVILHKQLNAIDEELTWTYKIRRTYIAEKYQPLIDGMYSDSQEVTFVDTIKTRAGKESVIETDLQVITLEAVQEVA